jgi:hypothetical protein
VIDKIQTSTETIGINGRVENSFMELNIDIKDQRKRLKNSEQEDFDNHWGVDPTGEFSQQISTFWGFKYRRNAKKIIMNELKSTMVESDSKLDKLRLASDLQVGLEILHMFVLDILGRHSSAAKIFSSKSSLE